MIKALILDLDNTIYPAESISAALFKSLYKLMADYRDEISEDDMQKARQDMSKQPFQKIAEKYDMPEELKEKGIQLLRELTYEGPIHAFEDYQFVKDIPVEKFLVTMGFTKMQQCKIDGLKLNQDFKETIVNDPDQTEDTKKEVFQQLLEKYKYEPQEVVVIGDDPESEIKAGKELGLITVLYDAKYEFGDNSNADYKINSFEELSTLPLDLK